MSFDILEVIFASAMRHDDDAAADQTKLSVLLQLVLSRETTISRLT